MLTRSWRDQPVTMIRASVTLQVLLIVYVLTVGARINSTEPISNQVLWFVLSLFLLHRISRGGGVAWVVLLVLNALPLLQVLLGTAGWPGWYEVGLVTMLAAQTVLLLSPAVRAAVFGRPVTPPALRMR